jgi:acetyltransferase
MNADAGAAVCTAHTTLHPHLSRKRSMTIRNLDKLFAPRSVAVIGASQKPHSVGATVLRNLLVGGFAGPIMPVNPKYDLLAGLKVFRRVADLPQVPDLAIICTPPNTVPKLIQELGERGTRAAIVLSAGINAGSGSGSRNLRQEMLDAARPYLLRILGPNCVGMLAPEIGLNASFAHTGAAPGKIAFVSQSGALVTGILDWAKSRGIGFSKFVSLGDSADIDFGDMLDYLASDAKTQAILLYIEDIHSARKFMSAARAAARNKPVLVLKAGRAPEAAKAAASHTGALAGADNVYDAAIRRAGMLRVLNTEELFDAVETLAHARPMYGERLAIMTNGGGPGVMATDAVIEYGGKLAPLSQATLDRLDAVLPATWSHANPVDIIGDAPAERYVSALEILSHDENTDAIMFIHAPTAIVPSSDIAAQAAPIARNSGRNIFACWLGGDSVTHARRTFSDAGIQTYNTPEDAVRGFMQVVQYRRNQNLLMEVPSSLAGGVAPDRDTVKELIRHVLASGRSILSEAEAKGVLAAYGIPVVETAVATTPEDAARLAQTIGFPVALKIMSPDITHKSDVGGVVLDLENADAVHAAAEAMRRRIHALNPAALLSGYTVQAMARRAHARELIVGVATDRTFGPVIMFGQGGTAVEVTADRAIGLPPLNTILARDLISHTRVAKLLAAYRNTPAADIDAVCHTLIQVSQMVIDLPEIIELDINPLVATDEGVIALDARIHLGVPGAGTADRLAIRPYPVELEERIDWHGERLLLRPIRPEDGQNHVAFFNTLDPEDVRFRMFTRIRELAPSQLARMTQIDYDREMAFIGVRDLGDGKTETLGVARAIADPDNVEAEFAVIVRSDLKGRGLGRLLMQKLIAYCRHRGLQAIVGETLTHNRPLIDLVGSLGFEVTPIPYGEGTMHLRLPLRQHD